MSKKACNAEGYNWLVNTPASDPNFTAALERSNEATIHKALEYLEGHEGEDTKELALRRHLRRFNLKRTAPVASNADVTATADRQMRTTNLELATLQGERDAQDQRAVEQTEKEAAIAQCYKAIGQVQTSNMFAQFATVSSFVWLRDVKAKKIYKDIPGVGTWDKFCESIGMARATVDRELLNLATFGETFLLTCGQLSVGYRELRQLRQLTLDGSIQLVDDCITIGTETIPIDSEHVEDLKAAIDWVLDENKAIAARVEKLEKQKDIIVKEETKHLEREKSELVKENRRLKAFDPAEKDRSFALEQVKEISSVVTELSNLCLKFLVDERVMEDPVLLGQVEGCFNSAELMLRDTRKRWEEVVSIFEN